jgi:hypothetical protein
MHTSSLYTPVFERYIDTFLGPQPSAWLVCALPCPHPVPSLPFFCTCSRGHAIIAYGTHHHPYTVPSVRHDWCALKSSLAGHPLTQPVGLDMIMGGPSAAAVSVTGAVVGHLWWWVIYGEGGQGLPGLREFGRAPSWVRALVSDGARLNLAGTGVHATPPRQQRQTTARTAGYNWGGAGQRLGSE